MPTITCPNCDGKFQSKKDLAGRQVRCPRCDSAFVVGEDVAEVILPRSAASAPPRAAPPKNKPATRSKSRKPARGKKRSASAGGGGFPKPLLICLGIAGLCIAGWYGLQALNNGAVAIPGAAGGADGGTGAVAATGGAGGSGLAGMLGFNDTPESLMKDYTACGKELQQVLAGVTDAASVEPAIKSIEEILWELIDIRRRAWMAPQVSKQELYKVLRQFSENEQTKAADVVSIIEKAQRQNSPHEKIRQALEELSHLARSASGAIRQGLEALPDPRNDLDKIEHERAALLRLALQQVLNVEDASGVDGAAKAVKETAGKLQALAERKAALPGAQSLGGPAQAKYLAWTVPPPLLMTEHAQILANKSVSVVPLSTALTELSTADSNISFAHVPGAFQGRGGGAQPAGDPSRPAGAGPLAGGPGRLPGRFEQGGAVGQSFRPTPKTGPAGPGEVVVILKGDIFTQQSADPKEQVAIRRTAFEVLREAQAVLRSDTGVSGSNGNIAQGIVSIRVRFDGDPQSLADQFTFGTVDAVDAAARQIEVTVSEALVEKVRKSMAQDR